MRPQSISLHAFAGISAWFEARLYATALGRTASVVRYRRDVTNSTHINAGRRQGTNCGFTTRTRSTDPNIDRAHSMLPRLVGCIDRCLLRGKWSAFTRPAETERSRTLPGNRVALAVRNRHDSVVERSLNVDHPIRNNLAFALFEFLVLGGLAGSACLCFCH